MLLRLLLQVRASSGVEALSCRSSFPAYGSRLQRLIHTTPAALGGGSHHDGPLPVHIPVPQRGSRTLFGEARPVRVTEESGYNPGKSDIYSFIGAAFGVLLTCFAVGLAPKQEPERKEAAILVEGWTPVTPEAQHLLEDVSTKLTLHTLRKPLLPGELPAHVPYLLIGGGTAAYYAALVIRARDAEARVLMVSDEPHLPYNRPPLSKELWWYGTEDCRETLEYKSPVGRTRDVFLETEGFFVKPHDLPSTPHGGVALARGRSVTRIDHKKRKAYLSDGSEIGFDQCLIATGVAPRKLSVIDESIESVRDRVIYYKGVDDYRRLDALAASAKSITVIGGGLLGTELAHSLKLRYSGLQVHQVFPEAGPLSKILPSYLSKFAKELIELHGIAVQSRAIVEEVRGDSQGLKLLLSKKKGEDTTKAEMTTDYIVVAVGSEPNVDIAKASGFELDAVNGGVMADAEMRVAEGIFAAGDACSYYDAKLGRRRVKHWENAQITGRLVGENMTGGSKSFWLIDDAREIPDMKDAAKLFALYENAVSEEEEGKKSAKEEES